MTEFGKAAIEAGFTKEQAEFMEQWVAPNGHTHEAADIVDLDEVLEEGIEIDDEGEDED